MEGQPRFLVRCECYEVMSEERPTILVLNSPPSFLTQYIIDINKLWMTCVRHAVVAHKDDIHNIG